MFQVRDWMRIILVRKILTNFSSGYGASTSMKKIEARVCFSFIFSKECTALQVQLHVVSHLSAVSRQSHFSGSHSASQSKTFLISSTQSQASRSIPGPLNELIKMDFYKNPNPNLVFILRTKCKIDQGVPLFGVNDYISFVKPFLNDISRLESHF